MAEAKTETTELVDTITKAVVSANKALEGEVLSSNVKTMTADEYRDYSKKKGTVMGRKKDQKTKLSVEEYMVLSKEVGWNDKSIADKHGISLEELNSIKRKARGGK